MQVWQKYDFCQGWAEEYAKRAEHLRVQAENSLLTPNERKEHLMAADWKEIISDKYAAAARVPWRSYPRFPLITPEEKQMVASRY